MPISITCPCGKKLKAPDSFAGLKARCPVCGKNVSVPENLEVIEEPIEFLEVIEESATTPATSEPASRAVQPAARGSASSVKPTPAPGDATIRQPNPTQTKGNGKPSHPASPTAAAPGSQVITAPNFARESTSKTNKTPTAAKGAAFLLSAATSDSPALKRRVLGAFLEEQIPPVRAPLGYRFAILVVAFLMILLPILYFLMIGGVGWGIWYHATHHTGIITSISDSTSRNSGRAYVVGILLYAAPMLAGATLLLFMLKPLFARPAEKPGTRTLKKSEEPLLFDFVSRICDSVNAPVPSRIAIDFEVNASASFNNGWKSFFNNDLVLTIGMPLAAGLTMRQFGGVLAHEFGHFAQGAGMRLTFIIRSINLWFARVVYERDEWDEWLKGLCETLDLRIGWMVYLARLCVWLSRRILWCLMMTGHFFSSLLMRQMEFDADRYEARFAGSETFKSTVRQLHVLNMANQGAISDLGDFYQEGRLGDNLPKLILINSDQISEKNRKIIDTIISESKTELFDTHPCDKARIANAEREECDGIFQLNLPASHLFMDFDARAKAVTWDFYKGIFGKKLKKSDIHPVDELLDRQKSQQETLKALARFFQGPIPLYRPIQGLETARKTNTDSGKEVANLKAARSQLIAMAPNFAKAWKKYDKLDTRKIEAELAEKMLEANLQVSEEDFSVPLTSKKEIAQARNKIEEQEAKILPQINAFESAVSIRLMTGLRLAQSAPLAGALAASGGTVGEIRELVSLLQKINGGIPDILELRNSKLAMERLFGALETNPSDEKLLKKIRKLVKDTHGSVNRVRSGYSDFLYPFDHAKKDLSVGMFLISDTPDVDNPLEVYEAVEGFVDKIGQLQARVLGRLCQIAEAMETHFQIPPLGDPPLEAESEAREEE